MQLYMSLTYTSLVLSVKAPVLLKGCVRPATSFVMHGTAGEVLSFGACIQSKPLLPAMDNTIKSELATQHVTPAQHFMVMTTAGKSHTLLLLLLLLPPLYCRGFVLSLLQQCRVTWPLTCNGPTLQLHAYLLHSAWMYYVVPFRSTCCSSACSSHCQEKHAGHAGWHVLSDGLRIWPYKNFPRYGKGRSRHQRDIFIFHLR